MANSDTIILQLGSDGDLVKKVQQVLRLEVTGTYDQITEAAVKNFQNKNDLPDVNGRVDYPTYEKLFKIILAKDMVNKIELVNHMGKVVELLEQIDPDLHEMSVMLDGFIKDLIENKNL